MVLLGDSITDGWRLPQSFPGKPYVNRGISGQTTPQMLVRMFPDVITLKPAALIVLRRDQRHRRQHRSYVAEDDRTQLRGDRRTGEGERDKGHLRLGASDQRLHARKQPNAAPGEILKLNTWMKDYSAKSNAIFADYYSATVDEKGMLRDGDSGDGLHPNAKCYERMVPVAVAAIQQALR